METTSIVKRAPFFISLALTSTVAFASPDTIFTNADIITMTGEDNRAKALAIKDGKIVAVGSQRDVMKTKGKQTKVRNLQGKTVAPGFIDAHGHFAQYLPLIESEFLYPAPLGSVNSIPDLAKQMSSYFDNDELDKNILHLAFGYDDAELQEKRHPTKQEFDAFSKDYNFCAIHISGHLATCNTAALEFIGLTKDSPNPSGGVIRRDENNEMTGVLEESATYAVLAKIPHMTDEDAKRRLGKAQDLFASYGITTAQEGLALIPTIHAMKSMAEQNELKIDLLAYAKWVDLEEAAKISPLGENNNGFKLAGVKLVGDGSPQGKTAYLSSPYYVPPHSHAYDYHGYPVLTQDEMNAWVDKAYEMNAQILSHSNGDASADILLNAIDKANEKYGKSDRRSVVVHAQTARLDQVKRMKENDMIASFFPAHTYFWGDWHRDSVLGPWRASNISPMGWANSVDLPFTIHMDAPIVYPDMMRNMWAAINRVTRSGDILGEHHRISPYQALQAITTTAAYQNFEEDSKGSIEVGKRADLVILDKNPLEVEHMDIKDIQVLETIKDGNTVFLRN